MVSGVEEVRRHSTLRRSPRRPRGQDFLTARGGAEAAERARGLRLFLLFFTVWESTWGQGVSESAKDENHVLRASACAGAFVNNCLTCGGLGVGFLFEECSDGSWVFHMQLMWLI